MTTDGWDVVGSGSENFPSGSPVRTVAEGSRAPLREGVGLCLSGGGFRAMLFHVGVLERLNLAGWLPRIDLVSSVSGGSITAGLLGLRWDELKFTNGVATNFGDLVTNPLRAFAHTKVDLPAVALGGLFPFVSISDRVVGKLKKYLYGDASLQDLTDEVRFVINATNLESGVLMRFSKPYIADYKVGMVENSNLALAEAVAASSAFPPFLSPLELDLSDATWSTVRGNILTSAGYRSDILLSDGGVYDNLGLEPVWDVYRTVLVSDAGGHLGPDPDPERDWARSIIRVLHIMDSQVRALRRRALIDSYKDDNNPHNGFFISTVTDYSGWEPRRRPYMAIDSRITESLAAISTRLTTLPDEQQERLINWGFAAADAGILAWLDADLPAAPWPYPDRRLT